MRMEATKFERESTKFSTHKIINRLGETVEIRVLDRDEYLTWDEVSSQALDKSICFYIAASLHEMSYDLLELVEKKVCGKDYSYCLFEEEFHPVGVIPGSQEIILQIAAYVEKH